MSDGKIRIFPLGDSALTVEFGKTVSAALNKSGIALSDLFEKHPFPGFIESVPAYASTTIFYDLVAVRHGFPDFPSAFEAVKRLAADAVKNIDLSKKNASRIVDIPVHFDKESALDLEFS